MKRFDKSQKKAVHPPFSCVCKVPVESTKQKVNKVKKMMPSPCIIYYIKQFFQARDSHLIVTRFDYSVQVSHQERHQCRHVNLMAARMYFEPHVSVRTQIVIASLYR